LDADPGSPDVPFYQGKVAAARFFVREVLPTVAAGIPIMLTFVLRLPSMMPLNGCGSGVGIGPPGNGKTHAVKALINQSRQPCLYVKSFKSCWGTDHDRIRAVFTRARKTTPSIVVMEDLDSLIDEENRAFFLNELDGFAVNSGIVVLATTNHPEKLDPAILDRPSRFDRKYYFNLPAERERSDYLVSWSQSLEPELRLSAASLQKLVEATDGFSFAYLKELFLSSMMQWMAESGSSRMDAVMMNRVTVLREQMNSAGGKKRKKKKARKATACRL